MPDFESIIAQYEVVDTMVMVSEAGMDETRSEEEQRLCIFASDKTFDIYFVLLNHNA